MATHLRAGEIQARQIDCSALTFGITLVVYININSNVNVGGDDDYISFGDGTSSLVPDIITYEIIDEELGIALVKYTTRHTYSAFGKSSSDSSSENAMINLQWQTSRTDVRDESYKIIFKISDRPPSGPRLTRFYTLHIKVIAPAPEVAKVSVNPISKHATIEWTNCPCVNVKSFQVWRRISSIQYDPEQCQTGMPYSLRYQLLEELPGDFTAYTDNNLAFGTQYCYRIMALVGENKTASRLSLNTCFIPKPAEAPVITNVTVQDTDSQNG